MQCTVDNENPGVSCICCHVTGGYCHVIWSRHGDICERRRDSGNREAVVEKGVGEGAVYVGV